MNQASCLFSRADHGSPPPYRTHATLSQMVEQATYVQFLPRPYRPTAFRALASPNKNNEDGNSMRPATTARLATLTNSRPWAPAPLKNLSPSSLIA